MKINSLNKYTFKLESQGITFHHLDYDTSELDGGRVTNYHCFTIGGADGAVLNELFVSHKSTFGDLLV